MRGILACAGALACALAGVADPLAATRADASPVSRPPVTRISVNGNGGDRIYAGVGAVLGGGGNARYLMDYPARERDQILDYLFKPGYGASLQILKLEIGGDADSSDGSEPSVEHMAGHVNCRAGYELSVAQRAVALNPRLLLYGLQWTAPGWVRRGTGTRFSSLDVSYLLSWLGCARRRGLTISYLGGWNESDTGIHQAWFRQLRRALNAHGYRRVRIVAGDSSGAAGWHYVGDRDVAILGTHDVCGFPTGVAGPSTACTSPWSGRHRAPSRQPMWASELGGMDGGNQRGCRAPCAQAMDRAVIRGYVDARLTGFIEWPALDAMPPGLPFENRGLVTADRPWSGSYRVNAMTWAIAQLTQFAWPPAPGGRVRWQYLNSASGLLRGQAADGSFVSLVRSVRISRHGTSRRGTDWSTIIEATTATSVQRAAFHITGGRRLGRRVVHVWASDFAAGSHGARFVRLPDIRPSRGGRFSLIIRPGWVYSLTTTRGQGKGAGRGRPATAFPLPFADSLASSGHAGTADDEPAYLAAQDGAFELAPCRVRDGRDRTCTEQKAVATPAFWHNGGAQPGAHYPYAIIGGRTWRNYKVSVDVLLPGAGASAGLIGRFGCRAAVPDVGLFDGYVFDVAGTGAWSLTRNANPTSSTGSACVPGPAVARMLASGTLPRPLRPGTWHRLSLSMSGSAITASVDRVRVAGVSDSARTSGPAGIEAGAFTSAWPRVQYSHLSVTRQPAARHPAARQPISRPGDDRRRSGCAG
ncbi:MAG TPA: hypothetical protein VMV07_18685 [Streptosporangiaceae bacterium]|nr:hypothetical protein [Streptosporangiaceae bacterium]